MDLQTDRQTDKIVRFTERERESVKNRKTKTETDRQTGRIADKQLSFLQKY
jgi:hypothetical protein